MNSALTVDLGGVSIAYDLHTMNQAAAWSGGFLNLDATQHKRLRGEGYAEPRGEPIAGLDLWRWGHDGSLDPPTDDLLPRGPLPRRWLDYHGHHLYGEPGGASPTRSTVGRFLEVPSAPAGATALRHTLRIGGGRELVLAAGRAIAGSLPPRLPGDVDGVTVAADAAGRWVVRIPADDRPRTVDVVRFAAAADRGDVGSLPPVDPAAMTAGGDALWPEVLHTVGYRGFQTGAYAVDTLTLPESTPWNTWFRTSALDFFPDGRMAVATVGGDVWVVSGVDDDLLNLRWKRFAGGLYEPFGLKVVDGLVYVTCKDRLTRLHDRNGDGEADFYESFSADDDVSTFFHAFNFDLQTDDAGNFYYAKSGQYTDYTLPGAVVKVSPDGARREVVATGFRTPNGMGDLSGRSADRQRQPGLLDACVEDQPHRARRVLRVRANARHAAAGRRTAGRSIIPRSCRRRRSTAPLIWMPQEVDNSSGGQAFVEDSRFGPLAGRLLHTSFGKGWLYYLMTQEVGGDDPGRARPVPARLRHRASCGPA